MLLFTPREILLSAKDNPWASNLGRPADYCAWRWTSGRKHLHPECVSTSWGRIRSEGYQWQTERKQKRVAETGSRLYDKITTGVV